MRIITGKYKGRHFDVPRNFKARPTTDFAKENLFNVLNGYLDFEETERALDLFAGTGSITYELLSRGCQHVTSIEKDPMHYKFILKVLKDLKAENSQPCCLDVFRYLKSAPEKGFDFIFADPPYALPELPDVPKIVLERGLLRPGGLFVMEHPKEYDFSNLPGFEERRVYGSVNFSLFVREEERTDA